MTNPIEAAVATAILDRFGVRAEAGPVEYVEYVCRHCGGDDIRSVEVGIWWQPVTLDRGEDGKPEPVDYGSSDFPDGTTIGVACGACYQELVAPAGPGYMPTDAPGSDFADLAITRDEWDALPERLWSVSYEWLRYEHKPAGGVIRHTLAGGVTLAQAVTAHLAAEAAKRATLDALGERYGHTDEAGQSWSWAAIETIPAAPSEAPGL